MNPLRIIARKVTGASRPGFSGSVHLQLKSPLASTTKAQLDLSQHPSVESPDFSQHFLGDSVGRTSQLQVTWSSTLSHVTSPALPPSSSSGCGHGRDGRLISSLSPTLTSRKLTFALIPLPFPTYTSSSLPATRFVGTPSSLRHGYPGSSPSPGCSGTGDS